MNKISRSRLAWLGTNPSTRGTTRRTRLTILGVGIAATAALVASMAGGTALAAPPPRHVVGGLRVLRAGRHQQPGRLEQLRPVRPRGRLVDAQPAAFGAKSLRISNAVVSGSFDHTFSKSLANEAGESEAENGGKSGGSRQSYFESQFQFASTIPALSSRVRT